MITRDDSDVDSTPVIMFIKVPSIFNMGEEDVRQSLQDGLDIKHGHPIISLVYSLFGKLSITIMPFNAILDFQRCSTLS